MADIPALQASQYTRAEQGGRFHRQFTAYFSIEQNTLGRKQT